MNFHCPGYRNAILIPCLLLALLACNSAENEKADTSHVSQARDPAALVEKARARQALGAFAEAVEELDQALRLEPDNIPARFALGEVYNEWDRREEAVAAYSKTLELDPAHIPARLGLASVYDKMTRNEWALAELQKVAQARPEDPEIHFKIALEHWYLQQLEECAQSYRQVIELKPDHIQAHLNLASVYEKLKDWDRALKQIGRSMQLARETNNEQALAIAENKLKFLKGRVGMTEEELRRKTQPPFE